MRLLAALVARILHVLALAILLELLDRELRRRYVRRVWG